MRLVTLAFGAVVAVVLTAALFGGWVETGVMSGLGRMIPRPQGVPIRATPSYGFKSGINWTWNRNLAHGCAAWSANERWAGVTLLVGSRCERQRQSGLSEGRRLSHLSFQDRLVFQGYWPWSSELYSKLMVFDEKGMIKTVLPCPHTLTAGQIGDMRTVATEAYTRAETDAERRVLARVRQRLAALTGVGLARA